MTKQRSRLRGMPWLILAAIGANGCETSLPVDSACLWVKPIYSAPPPEDAPHADDPGNVFDTPETQAAIEEHNSDFLCRCRNDCE